MGVLLQEIASSALRRSCLKPEKASSNCSSPYANLANNSNKEAAAASPLRCFDPLGHQEEAEGANDDGEVEEGQVRIDVVTIACTL